MKIKLQNFMGKNVKRLSTYYRETATQLKYDCVNFSSALIKMTGEELKCQ